MTVKLIDVIEKLSKGEIKDGTLLTIDGRNNKQYKYTQNCFLDDYHVPLQIFDERQLNSNVIFIEPKTKKYRLRLDEDDSLSYINKNNNENACFSYEVTNRIECHDYKTKFTQEEIDNDKLLKFIEQHGIKEVVDEDETN